MILAGAAALGAYEAGVLEHVVTAVARDLGRARVLDVVSGTSAGAINATALAAFADDPAAGVARLCATWSGLRLGRVLRPSGIEVLSMIAGLTAPPSRLQRALRLRRARGGLLDPRPIIDLLTASIPVDRLTANLRAGHLRGVAISATHVATGRATVFYQTAERELAWAPDASMTPVETRLGIAHAMASAAIPLLFPPVDIAGDLYCDGGLRQMVPLSPSLHLGAHRLLVINPLGVTPDRAQEQARREASTSPLYLAGKALNALFVDRLDVDLARLEQLSGVLRAGTRRFGAGFETDINDELARDGGAPLRAVTAMRIDPSHDLGQLAADYAASPAFARRERGLVGRLLRWLGEQGQTRAGDVLSYLMFDGEFAAELIRLGRADARARHAELCAFLA